MNQKINFPKDREFIRNLILQRTSSFVKVLRKLVIVDQQPRVGRYWAVDLLERHKLIEKFLEIVLEDMLPEYEQLVSRIPDSCLERIVSVGPGNGLMEMLIALRGKTKRFLLIDVEETDSVYHGYQEKGSGYANLCKTSLFIKRNLVSNNSLDITLCNPTKEAIPDFSFTLFISLLSMGFHYPCDEYTDFIISNMESCSIVVLDKRKGVIDQGHERLLEFLRTDYFINSEKSERQFLSRRR